MYEHEKLEISDTTNFARSILKACLNREQECVPMNHKDDLLYLVWDSGVDSLGNLVYSKGVIPTYIMIQWGVLEFIEKEIFHRFDFDSTLTLKRDGRKCKKFIQLSYDEVFFGIVHVRYLVKGTQKLEQKRLEGKSGK